MNSGTRATLLTAVFAGAVVVAGSLMPWATVSTGFGQISKAGTDGDGMITLVAGLSAAALAGASLRAGSVRKWARWLIAACGALIAVVAIADISDVQSAGSGLIAVSVGTGLWIVAIAALALVASGVMLIRGRADQAG